MDKTLIANYVSPMKPEASGLIPGGRLRTPVRAIIFDVYGTLFISASGGGHADPDPSRHALFEHLLAAYDLRISVADLLAAYRSAISNRHAQLRAEGEQYPEVDIEAIWRQVLPGLDSGEIRRFSVEFEFITNPVYPMPGLKTVLSDCAARSAAMGIVSNAQFYTPYLFKWLLDADLSSLGFDPDLVLLSYHFGCAKPSARIFEEAAGRLIGRGIEPLEALFVGNDMLNDVYAASLCGFQTALFAGDRRSLRLGRDDPRCRGIRPDVIITELGQLTGYLEKIAPPAADG